MKNKKILFTVGETVNRIINWSFIFLLAFFLTSTEYGVISVLISLEGMFAGVLLGGFDRAAIRFLSDLALNITSRTIILLWLLLASLMMLLILLSVNFSDWNEKYYIRNNILPVFLVALFSLTSSRLIGSISRAYGDLFTFLAIKVVAPISKILVLFYMLYMGNTVADSYFIAVLLGFLPIVVWPIVIYTVKNHVNGVTNLKVVKSIYSYALPFLPHSVAGIVLANIDRIMINDMVGVEEAGIYNFSYLIGSALSFVYAITAVTYERDLFSNASRNSLVNDLQNTYFRLLSQLGYWAIIGVFILYVLLAYLDMKYATQESLKISLIVMISYIVNVHYLQASYYLAISRKTASIAIITVFTMMLNVLFNYFAISKFGVIGAAFATYLTYIILSVLMMSMASYKTSYEIFNKSAFFYALIGLIAFSVLIINVNALLIFSCVFVLFFLKQTIYNAKIIWL